MTASIERIEFHSEAFRALLRSAGAVALTESIGSQIADRANANAGGYGYEHRSSRGTNRARTVVISVTRLGRQAEAESKALTTALGGS